MLRNMAASTSSGFFHTSWTRTSLEQCHHSLSSWNGGRRLSHRRRLSHHRRHVPLVDAQGHSRFHAHHTPPPPRRAPTACIVVVIGIKRIKKKTRIVLVAFQKFLLLLHIRYSPTRRRRRRVVRFFSNYRANGSPLRPLPSRSFTKPDSPRRDHLLHTFYTGSATRSPGDFV